MWGHLKDVGFKVDLKSIVNAVAPPVESDDDDEYETDGDDDSQDDDIVSVDENEPVETEGQEEYDGDDDEYEDEQPRGFGLVGMLSRALDSKQHRYEDSQSHEEQEEEQFEQEDVVDLNPIVSASMSTRSFHSDSFQGESMSDEPYTDIDMHEDDIHHHASYLEQALHFPKPPNEEEAPVRRSLVRETGSLSPADAYSLRTVQVPLPSVQPLQAKVSESATKEQKIPEVEQTSAASPPSEKDGESAPTSVPKSRLPTPNRTKSSERVASVTKPTDRAMPPDASSRVPLRSSSDTVALDNLPGLPSFIVPGPEQVEQNHNAVPAEKDTDSAGSSNKSASVVETASTVSATKAERVPKIDYGGQNEKPASASPPNERPTPPLGSQDEAVVDDDEEEEDTQSLERGNLGSQHNALVRDESEEDTEPSFHEREWVAGVMQTQSLGEDKGSLADPEMLKDSRLSVSEKNTVPKMSKVAATSLSHDDKGETTQPEDRSKELERQLRQAEMHIVELQQQAARQMEVEEENQQLQMQRFQEKEARLLEAAAEDQEQELVLLRNDMDSRFAALQQERDRERKEFVKERDQMERLLNESISTVDAAERDKKQAQSKQDNDSAQFQKRQERALRMAEDKLAQTMALLDDREEQVENLNATVKNLKSKMSVHQEGAHEAEEELDELHTENETLRHHVQTFEAQCAELKSKVSELEGESDKVSGLKVCNVDAHTRRYRCYNLKVR